MKKDDRWQAMARQEKEAMELYGKIIALGLVLMAGAAVAWGWIG